jgi:hypothetical protein
MSENILWCRAPIIFVDKNQHKILKVQSTEILKKSMALSGR